jgi:hypothetical protein
VIYVFWVSTEAAKYQTRAGLLGDLISQATVTFFEAILRIGVG